MPAAARWAALRLSGGRPRRPLPTATGAYAMLVVLLCLPGGLKLVKAWTATEGTASVADLALTVAADAGVACAATAAALLLLGVIGRRRRGAWMFWIPASLFTLCVLGLNALEHQAWVRSGSLLDWKIFWYTIQHFADLRIVIAAETTTGGVVLLVLAGVAALLPLISDVVGAKVVRRRPTPSLRHAVILAIASLPLLTVADLRPPRAPELHPITQSASFGLLFGAFSAAEQALEAQSHFEAPQGEEFAQRIESRLDAASLHPREEEERPKNVLLIVLESTRFDATGLYVPSLDTTPSMRRMARNGAVAERMYVDIPHTSKALVSVLCGYEPKFSVEITEAEPGGLPGPCMAHVLGRLGRRTAFFQAATGSYENRHQLAGNMGYEEVYTRESYDETGFEETNYLSIEDKIMVKPLLQWAQQSKKSGEPFFATVLTCISHHSYGLPSDFDVRKYRRRPARIGARMPRPWSEYNLYLNTVRYADEMIDEMVDGLKRAGVLDDTLVVVVGDHGQAFLEHGQKAHNTVIWEEGLRVPFLMHNRRLFSEPQRLDGLRRQVDIAPTVLAALGIDHDPELFSGQNMLATEGHEVAFSSCWYDERCMAETRGNIRVIDHFEHQPMEVFDLEADPFERRNLLRHRDPAIKTRWQSEAAASRKRMRAHVERLAAHHEGATRGEHPWILAKEPRPAHPVRARLGKYVELLGYDTPTHEVAPGGFWETVVYFKCLEQSDLGWRFFGSLETVDGRTHQKDHHPANGRMYLHECKPGTYVADHVRVWIPDDFPPGKLDYYWGSVFLEELGHVRRTNRRKGRRPVVPLTRGVLVKDNSLRLAVLDVQPKYSKSLAKLRERDILQQPPAEVMASEVRFGSEISLVDVRFDPAEVRRLASTKLITTWKVNRQPRGPWQLFVHLETKRFRYRRHRSHTPLDGIHPIASWQPGTWVRDSHTLPIGKNVPLGEAEVWIGISYGRKRMKVTAPGSAIVRDHRVLAGTINIVR